MQVVLDISVRVSQQGSRSDDRLYSPATQEEACRRLIEGKGHTVGQVVSEVNVSGGKSASDRGVERLVQRVESGESGGIVVYDFSRLSREDAFSATMLVGRIKLAGGVVYGVADNYDSDAPMAAVMTAIYAEQAHAYLQTARERSVAGAKRAKEAGRYCGHTPRGYDRQDGRLVINQYDSDTIRGIFDGALSGWSWREMQQYAEERAMKVTFGGIKHILHNPVYVGKGAGGASPAIIDQETFERVQKVKRKRPALGKASQKTLVQGLAVCANCGKTLVVTPNSRGVTSYYCKGRGINGCDSRGCVSTNLLDGYVEGIFLAAFEDGGPFARAYADDHAVAETDALLRQVESEREALLGNTSLLAQLGERAAKVLADADARVELAQAAYSEAFRQAEALSGIARMIDLWISGELSMTEKRRLLARAVDRIEVGNGRVEVGSKARIIFHGEVAADAPDDSVSLFPLVQDRSELALDLS